MLLCSIQWKIHFLGCCKGVPRGLKVFASTRDKHANNKCTSQHCRIIHSLITTSPGTLADSVPPHQTRLKTKQTKFLLPTDVASAAAESDFVVFVIFPRSFTSGFLLQKHNTLSNIIVTGIKAAFKSKHYGKYTNFTFRV